MFTQIKTSKANKIIVTDLSRRFNLGAENVIARIAFAYSLSSGRKLKLSDISDSQGKEYSKNPQRLTRAVRLLREMKGFNSAGDFFEGVTIEETFEGDFRPLAEDSRLMPFMLVMILDLYFRLTPITMVAETPEVQELSRLMRVPAKLIVEVLQIYQTLDPYLRRQEVSASVLLQPCRQIWERYANLDTAQLAEYAQQLSYYFR